MRILQVITSLRIGGAEKLVSEISPMLIDKGYQVDVCAFDGVETNFKKALIDAGIRIISFGKNNNVYNPIFIFRLAKLMRGYDIVHTHNTSPQLFAAIASICCSTKLVTTEHNTSNRRRNWNILSYMDRWMYNRYHTVICVSDKTKENLMRFIKHTETRVVTIYNGVNITTIKTALPLMDKPKDRKIVTMVAGFRQQKDQDTLLRAFSYLNKRKYELWLVGDGERRDVIENLISELHLENCVKLLGIRNDVPSVLKASDIIIMSSHWEGFGLAAAEGMAAGKPVIATDIPGLAEVVSGAGVLFPHQDAKDLAKEIERLVNDKIYYDSVAKRCSKRANEYDISKMVDGYEHVYNSLM